MGMANSIVVQCLIILVLLVSLVPCRESNVGTNLKKGSLPSPPECTNTGGRLAKSTSNHVHGCPLQRWTSSIVATTSPVDRAPAPAPAPSLLSPDLVEDMGKINATAIASPDLNYK